MVFFLSKRRPCVRSLDFYFFIVLSNFCFMKKTKILKYNSKLFLSVKILHRKMKAGANLVGLATERNRVKMRHQLCCLTILRVVVDLQFWQLIIRSFLLLYFCWYCMIIIKPNLLQIVSGRKRSMSRERNLAKIR